MNHAIDYVELMRAHAMIVSHAKGLLAAYQARVNQMRADLARKLAIA